MKPIISITNLINVLLIRNLDQNLRERKYKESHLGSHKRQTRECPLTLHRSQTRKNLQWELGLNHQLFKVSWKLNKYQETKVSLFSTLVLQTVKHIWVHKMHLTKSPRFPSTIIRTNFRFLISTNLKIAPLNNHLKALKLLKDITQLLQPLLEEPKSMTFKSQERRRLALNLMIKLSCVNQV